MKSQILVLLAICLLATGCISASTDASPTDTQTLTPTQPPTSPPTKTALPTATFTPTKDIEPKCEYDADFFTRLKSALPVSEVVIYHNIINDTHTLGVWYVDPEIQLDNSGQAKTSENQIIAINNALDLMTKLKRVEPCVSTFDVINPIVVDNQYNGWFSGTTQIEDIPNTLQDIISREILYAATEIGYLRENFPNPIDKAPSKSCDWPTTSGKIHQHFSPDLANTAFYFVRDEFGNNVWANFYIQSIEDVYAESVVSIVNIATELDCLHPAPGNIIVSALTPDHKATLIGFLPNTNADTGTSWNGFDLNDFQYTTYGD